MLNPAGAVAPGAAIRGPSLDMHVRSPASPKGRGSLYSGLTGKGRLPTIE